jgi:CBS-domain-containing membrane protein
MEPGPWTLATRKRVFTVFYDLTARDLMDTEFRNAAFVGPHGPVIELLEMFLTVDHAWVVAEGGERRVESIIVRQDLLPALAPTQASYSRLHRARFRSLAHGSADCFCCFAEGRILHRVPPDALCRDILHAMEDRGIQYVPVVDQGVLVGEIGSPHLLAAIYRLQKEHTGSP